jgi:FkbM family methyltransferase
VSELAGGGAKWMRRFLGKVRSAAWIAGAIFDPDRLRLFRFYRSGGEDRWLFGADLTEESVVLEVGGHEGDWAAKLRRRQDCTIHIFEPVAAYRAAIMRRFHGDPRALVHPFGLGSRSRRTTIGVAGVESSLFAIANPEPVDIVDVVEFLETNGVGQIDLMSINCEGGEYEILPRLIDSGVVRRVRRLQVQFHRIGSSYRRDAKWLRRQLERTHERVCSFPFVWECWRLR